MTTRAATLAPQHVSALNMVGLEFVGKDYTKVSNAWKTYIDHLNSVPKGNDDSLINIWAEKKDDLLSDLLYEMGQALGFDFDKVHIKKAGYFPQAWADQESEQNYIRRKLADVFLNDEPIPMAVREFPADPKVVEQQIELFGLIKEHYEGKRAMNVIIKSNESEEDSSGNTD